MSKVTSVLAGSLLAMAVSASATAAEGGFSASGNVGVTSDYRFRGISQSDSGAALQGGADLDFGNGFYLGAWASQVDFGYDATDYELDLYGGYAGQISESVGFDVGFINYAYPGGEDEDYQEIYGSLSFSDLTVGAAYSNEYWAETGKFYYLYGEYSLALPADLSLDFHLGLNQLDEDGGFLAEGEDSYIDYSVSLGKEFGGLGLSASLVGTDVSDSECFDLDWCEPTILATATYTW